MIFVHEQWHVKEQSEPGKDWVSLKHMQKCTHTKITMENALPNHAWMNPAAQALY